MLALLQWSMNDGPLFLKVILPVVGVIHQQCSKFISGVQIKEKGDLNLMKVLILSIFSLHKDLNCILVQKHTHTQKHVANIQPFWAHTKSITHTWSYHVLDFLDKPFSRFKLIFLFLFTTKDIINMMFFFFELWLIVLNCSNEMFRAVLHVLASKIWSCTTHI